jgi:mannose-6-phosphate isomerase
MSEKPLYPLVFSPLFKELVWGGSKLGSQLRKSCDPALPIGESWELVDIVSDQSVVHEGPLAGASLNDLVRDHRDDLLGPVGLDGGRFPLLVKFIDAAKTLSVQVHPNEENAAKLGGRAKNEVWFVLQADPDARLYVGLKEGVDGEILAKAIGDGSIEELLVAHRPKVGEMVHVCPGTFHAIGAGMLLAEVQQPSDTTYRAYDWGRVGLDGKPRQLHIEQALKCVDFDSRPAMVRGDLDAGHFAVRSVQLTAGVQEKLDGAGPLVVVGLAGSCQLKGADDHPAVAIERGEVVLLPHCCRPGVVQGTSDSTVLVVSFPAA